MTRPPCFPARRSSAMISRMKSVEAGGAAVPAGESITQLFQIPTPNSQLPVRFSGEIRLARGGPVRQSHEADLPQDARDLVYRLRRRNLVRRGDLQILQPPRADEDAGLE